MKVIFLDVDKTPDQNTRYCISELVKQTGAKIVISSDYHKAGRTLDQVKAVLSLWYGFPVDSVCDFTEKVFYGDLQISRGAEIDLYLRKHEGEIENYVILDDEPIALLSQADHFVQVPGSGLIGYSFREALRILG